MVNVQLPDHIYENLSAAAAARHMTLAGYLEALAGQAQQGKQSDLKAGGDITAAFLTLRESLPGGLTAAEIKELIEEGRA